MIQVFILRLWSTPNIGILKLSNSSQHTCNIINIEVKQTNNLFIYFRMVPAFNITISYKLLYLLHLVYFVSV